MFRPEVPKLCGLVAQLEEEGNRAVRVAAHRNMQVHSHKREKKPLGCGLGSFRFLHTKSFCKWMEGPKQHEIALPKPFICLQKLLMWRSLWGCGLMLLH